MPVIAAVAAADANEALLTPSRRRTTPFTSRRVVASTTHATCRRGSFFDATTIVLAERDGG